jgi:PAS domain S-box-containing protein
MRQNLEEMQATQEELARLRQDDEKRTREMQLIVDNTRNLLKNLVDAIPGGYTLKDSNGVIHFANDEGAKYYGSSSDKIIGKTDHELLDAKIYKREHNYDEKVLKDGDKEYSEEREVKGKIIKYNVIKKQFQIEEIHQTGVLTIRKKV